MISRKKAANSKRVAWSRLFGIIHKHQLLEGVQLRQTTALLIVCGEKTRMTEFPKIKLLMFMAGCSCLGYNPYSQEVSRAQLCLQNPRRQISSRMQRLGCIYA